MTRTDDEPSFPFERRPIIQRCAGRAAFILRSRERAALYSRQGRSFMRAATVTCRGAMLNVGAMNQANASDGVERGGVVGVRRDLGEPAYRGRQLFGALFKRRLRSLKR
jgi:hypothetical protein